MNAPIAVKRSYLASQRSTVKKFVKAFADATRFIVDNKEGTMRPLIQLLNSNDPEVVEFAYQYLHTNSEATLYPPDEAVKNLIRMSAYMDKKLGSISANRVVEGHKLLRIPVSQRISAECHKRNGVDGLRSLSIDNS